MQHDVGKPRQPPQAAAVIEVGMQRKRPCRTQGGRGLGAAHEGKDNTAVQDAKGRYFIRDMVELARKGGGFYEYAWKNPRSGEVDTLKVSGSFECNDGAVLHEWALAGRGLAWRSLWEVGQDLKEGRLTSVLDAWQAQPMGIYAVFPQRRHLPLRVRLFIYLLKETYSRPSYWELR